MSTEQSLGERIKEFMHLADENDEPIRNHLSVRGSITEVERCLHHARRAQTDGTALDLDGAPIPLAFEESRYHERNGEWVTLVPGQLPERRREHEEHAEASFAFATGEPLDGAIARLSEEFPTLEVRYAWLRHHGDGPDTLQGGLWQAGRRLAEKTHDVEAVRADARQLADLVRELDDAEAPPPPAAA